MLIHFESGACEGGYDIYDLNEKVAFSRKWDWIIWDAGYDDYRQAMIDRQDLKELFGDDVLPYYCCRTNCQEKFPMLSSLFQNIESTACDKCIDDFPIGKLIRWLGNGQWN